MNTSLTISLAPLSLEWHVDALQQVYLATPAYWAIYNLLTAPAGQADNDLRAAAETPGRTMMGIVCRVEAHEGASAGVELIGLIDFRLHWPNEQVVSIGMVMWRKPINGWGWQRKPGACSNPGWHPKARCKKHA